MRLVARNRQQVQSLGRHSVGNTGYEGKVAETRAIANTLSDLAFTAANMIDQRQQQKADLNQNQREAEFWKKWGGRDFFNVNELPGDLQTPDMQLDGAVPSAQFIPQLYEAHMKEVMEESSSMIGMPGSKKKWMGDQIQTYNKKLVSVQMEANNLFETQTQKAQIKEYNDAMGDGNTTLALDLANKMWLPEDVKEGYREDARVENEILSYEDITSIDYINSTPEERAVNDAELDRAIETLSKTQSEYVKANGNFDSTTKISVRDKLIAKRKARKDALKSKNKYGEQNLKYRVESLRSAATEKLTINEDEYQRTLYDLKVWNYNNNNELHKLQLEFEDDLKTYRHAKTFLAKNPDQRRQESAKGHNVFGNDHPSRNARSNAIIDEMGRKFNQDLLDDPMGAADELGHFEDVYGASGMTRIEWRNSPEEIADQLRNRLVQFETLNVAQGGIGGGPLKAEEANKISVLMNSMTSIEQQRMISTVQMGMGDKSGLFYGQLSLNGSSKTFSIAGGATAGGNEVGSINMLQGMEYYKENSDEYKDIKTSIDAGIDSILENSYSTKGKKKAAIKEAILHSYVGYTKGGNQTSFSNDVLRQAARDATGGLFEYNGDKFPNPTYSRSETKDTMMNWIKNTSSAHYAEVGVPDGLSAEEFAYDLRNEKYKLIALPNTGEFKIQTTVDDGRVLRDRNTGKAYVLKYDPYSQKVPEPEHILDYIRRWVGIYE